MFDYIFYPATKKDLQAKWIAPAGARNEENFIGVLGLCMNIDTFVAVPSEPGLILELEGIVSTDSSWEVKVAEDWRKDVRILLSLCSLIRRQFSKTIAELIRF